MKLIFKLTLNSCGRLMACNQCAALRLRTISEEGCTWKCGEFGGDIPDIKNKRGRSHRL